MTIHQFAEAFFFEKFREIPIDALQREFEHSSNRLWRVFDEMVAMRSSTTDEIVRKLEVAIALRRDGHDIMLDKILESVIADLVQIRGS